jgi:hypothetical protein
MSLNWDSYGPCQVITSVFNSLEKGQCVHDFSLKYLINGSFLRESYFTLLKCLLTNGKMTVLQSNALA